MAKAAGSVEMEQDEEPFQARLQFGTNACQALIQLLHGSSTFLLAGQPETSGATAGVAASTDGQFRDLYLRPVTSAGPAATKMRLVRGRMSEKASASGNQRSWAMDAATVWPVPGWTGRASGGHAGGAAAPRLSPAPSRRSRPPKSRPKDVECMVSAPAARRPCWPAERASPGV